MRKAEESDLERILKYLRNSVQECLYLYIDVSNYGIGNDNMTVWIEESDDGLDLVLMKYYDSYQIYSHTSPDEKLIRSITKQLKDDPAAMISARRDIIESLQSEMTGYRAEYGYIYRIKKNPCYAVDDKLEIKQATEEDAEEIAKLICSNKEIGEYFTVDILSKQMKDRIRTKTGRSYIIYRDGVLVAHIATYAETKDMAIVSGAIVHPEYGRSTDFMMVKNYMHRRLEEEGKQAYSLANIEKMINYHDKFDTRCSEYGRLIREYV